MQHCKLSSPSAFDVSKYLWYAICMYLCMYLCMYVYSILRASQRRIQHRSERHRIRPGSKLHHVPVRLQHPKEGPAWYPNLLHLRVSDSSPLCHSLHRLINVHGCRCFTSVRRPKKDSLCRASREVAELSLSDSRGATWCRQIGRYKAA